MAQLVLKNIDAETAEKLEVRAKRLGTTPEEEASRLLREHLRADPHREPATTSTVKTPAIVTTTSTLNPEIASDSSSTPRSKKNNSSDEFHVAGCSLALHLRLSL